MKATSVPSNSCFDTCKQRKARQELILIKLSELVVDSNIKAQYEKYELELDRISFYFTGELKIITAATKCNWI